MPFPHFRKYLPRSSRNDQEKLAQLSETSPDENPGKLDQVPRDARSRRTEAVQTIHSSQAQSGTDQTPQSPKKLQKRAPSLRNGQYAQYPVYAPPQNQPAFAPAPPHPGPMIPYQQYPAPISFQSGPPPPSPHQWQIPPTPHQPFPPNFQTPPPQQPLYPWTPYQGPVDSWSSTAVLAVPLYELPPPDLMDYEMSHMIGVRMRPEWNRMLEDRHWDRVRRERSKVNRREMGEDGGLCIVM